MALRRRDFAAWAITILLLLLIGRLAMTAIRVGDQLALYDVQLREFTKQLINETMKNR